jgi:hypothetical protein
MKLTHYLGTKRTIRLRNIELAKHQFHRLVFSSFHQFLLKNGDIVLYIR